MEPAVFSSKVDAWLAVILIGAAVLTAGAVVSVGIGGSWLSGLAISPMLLLTAVLPLWLVRSTYYVLDQTELRIHSGPFRWRVRLKDIRSVTRTRNPLSGPALSLDRLRIDYDRGKSIMISPADRDGFSAELERRLRTVR
jgi:hypothetical protein